MKNMIIIDLSRKLEDGAPAFPPYPPMSIERMRTIEKDKRNSEKLHMSVHQGTHVDAPYHFIKDGNTIDKVNLRFICGKAEIIDLTSKKAGDSITREDLMKQEDKFRSSKKILLMTGWDRKGNEYYQNYPALSVDACKFLLKKGVEMVGMDVPSPGPIGPKGDNIHRLLLKKNIYIIEGLTNLPALKDKRFTFLCLPLNLVGTSAAPCRAVAIIE